MPSIIFHILCSYTNVLTSFRHFDSLDNVDSDEKQFKFQYCCLSFLLIHSEIIHPDMIDFYWEILSLTRNTQQNDESFFGCTFLSLRRTAASSSSSSAFDVASSATVNGSVNWDLWLKTCSNRFDLCGTSLASRGVRQHILGSWLITVCRQGPCPL